MRDMMEKDELREALSERKERKQQIDKTAKLLYSRQK